MNKCYYEEQSQLYLKYYISLLGLKYSFSKCVYWQFLLLAYEEIISQKLLVFTRQRGNLLLRLPVIPTLPTPSYTPSIPHSLRLVPFVPRSVPGCAQHLPNSCCRWIGTPSALDLLTPV